MRRCSLLIFTLLAGCSSEQSLAPSVEPAQLRQPLPGVMSLPLFLGRDTGAQLGTSLDACRGAGFVAGAPGDNSALLVTDGGVWFDSPIPGLPDAGAVGISVVCDGTVATPRVVTAGERGAFNSTLQGTWQPIDDGVIETVARGVSPAIPLLVGEPSTGSVTLYGPNAGGYSSLETVLGTTGMGSALVWHPAGGFFAVGNPVASTVRLHGWTTAGGVTTGAMIQGPPGSSFGAALAIGDVHPNPGAELIVGAPGTAQVFIYGESMGGVMELMVLDAPDPVSGSFGLSLAVERLATTATLNGLWVGDPLNESVVRFLGDAGETLRGPTLGAYFGFSLAVSGTSLAIGAPLYSDAHFQSGAIFKLPLDTAIVNGVAMTCDVREECTTPSCQAGRCLGGVACLPTRQQCPLAQCVGGVCLSTADAGADAGSDAGTDAGSDGGSDAGLDAGLDAGADAGSDAGLDAGPSSDGGLTLDAGTDGGEVLLPDGGVAPAGVTFTTCSCSGIGAVPLVLLSMVFGRKRRPSKR